MFKSKTTMLLQEEGQESAARSYAIDLLLNTHIPIHRAKDRFEESFPQYGYVFDEVCEDLNGVGGI